MLDAHVQAAFIVGVPFSKPGGHDFRANNITHSVSNLGGTMLKHRLTPPPDEVYSLHRKLSGAFLACIKIGAVVPCREMLFQVYEQYNFSNDYSDVASSTAQITFCMRTCQIVHRQLQLIFLESLAVTFHSCLGLKSQKLVFLVCKVCLDETSRRLYTMCSSSLSPDSGGVSFLQVFWWRNKNIGIKFIFWRLLYTVQML